MLALLPVAAQAQVGSNTKSFNSDSRLAQSGDETVVASEAFRLSGGMGGNNSGSPAGGEGSEAATSAPPSMGALPIDLSTIHRLRVAGTLLDEAPMRVGNLDILAPFADKLSGIGASASQVSARNIPGNANTPTNDQFFQINLFTGPPIVLASGRAVAWINQVEQPLRAAPLVMGGKIWLPVYSLAPLMGAACRVDSTGTLNLNPTIQSVELFQVRGTTVLTVKSSAPLNAGSVLMGTLDDPPKIYLDFPGFSMGFDASNSTNEKVLAGSFAEVARVRGGLFQKFPDTTRVVLDLKGEATGVTQPLPDKTVFALLLQRPNKPAVNRENTPVFTDTTPTIFPGSLRGLTIVVDAGHGGSDNGAVGARSMEKTHTLSISQKLRDVLIARGATVLMTRDSDSFPSLYSRPQFANQRKADLFISVHINSYRSTSTGTETFYYTGHSLPFAREVHKELIKATGLRDRGVQSARFVVIRNTVMPAILTETCFISNPAEEALLMQPQFRERVARGMAQGIQNYVDKYLRRATSG